VFPDPLEICEPLFSEDDDEEGGDEVGGRKLVASPIIPTKVNKSPVQHIAEEVNNEIGSFFRRKVVRKQQYAWEILEALSSAVAKSATTKDSRVATSKHTSLPSSFQHLPEIVRQGEREQCMKKLSSKGNFFHSWRTSVKASNEVGGGNTWIKNNILLNCFNSEMWTKKNARLI
jgi:hypothetical protein